MIIEGKIKKGGRNKEPSSSRPVDPPKGQQEQPTKPTLPKTIITCPKCGTKIEVELEISLDQILPAAMAEMAKMPEIEGKNLYNKRRKTPEELCKDYGIKY